MSTTIHHARIGSGRPVILIHGWAMHGSCWCGLAEHLARRHQVISVDLRGHGRSAQMPGPFDFAACARDVIDLIDMHSLQRPVLAGWSMGASIMLKMIEQGFSDIRAAIFISANPSLVARKDYPHGVAAAVVRRLYKKVERNYPGGLREFYKLLPADGEADPAESDVFSAVLDPSCAPSRQAALQLLSCLQEEDLRELVPLAAGVRSLIIHGTEDRICHPGAAGYLGGMLLNAQRVMLHGTGHVPFLTRRAEVCRVVGDFLGAA